MWWLQLLFFSLGVLVPVVLSRWLEERFYEHHDLPGKSSFQRLKFALMEVLAGNETMPETGFMTLKDRPVSLNLKMVSGAVVLVSWLCVFIGLYFSKASVLPWTIGLGEYRCTSSSSGLPWCFWEPC